MDKQAISNLIENNFSNMEEVKEGVYRATKNYKDAPFQILYFDSTLNILSADFDLVNYQRELLIEDYYSKEGSIQWSFYLYFLVPEDESSNLNFESLKHSVESDRKLARKFVVTYSELKKIFCPTETNDLEPPKDIEDSWYEGLPLGLRDDVFDSDLAMTEIVKRFVYKSTSQKPSPKQNKAIIPLFPQIKSLHLQEYRKFPIRKQFQFGLVNLIHGSNAVGKTSLIEAIELAVCGKTFRNPSVNEQFNLNITGIDSDEMVSYTKKVDSYYRSCDFHWYKRNYRSDNKLHSSFNRFNYFDADAAALFSERIEKEGGINKALNQIVLGLDTINLFERIQKISSLFSSEKSVLTRQVELAKAS